MGLVDSVKRDLEKEKFQDSLTKTVLEMNERDSLGLSHRDIASIPATLFSAGVETTATTT